jgi:SAM-dependent methyltransferase
LSDRIVDQSSRAPPDISQGGDRHRCALWPFEAKLSRVHPTTYREFERICIARRAGGRVLEIGAVPSGDSLLTMPTLAGAAERVGLNLDGPHRYGGFEIRKGDANRMDCFEDARFDVVLCNAVLEHDKFFWRTLAEIRRVTRPGGLVVLGTPGYLQCPAGRRAARAKYLVAAALWKLGLFPRVRWLLKSTPTVEIHNAPGDYYRFSPQAFREVFFEDMDEVEIRPILFPPIIVGAGVTPREGAHQS